MRHPAVVPPRALILLVVLTIIWGTNWPLFVYALREVSVWTFRSYAMPVGAIALMICARWRAQSLRVQRGDWRQLVLSAFFTMTLWNIVSTYAAVLIPSGQSAILAYTMPLWAALIAWIALGQSPTQRQLAALLLGLAAIGLLVVPGLESYSQAPLGFVLGLVSAIVWAIGTLIYKRHAWQTPVLTLTAWQSLVAAVPIWGVAAAVGDYQWFVPSWQSIAVVTYIAVVPMAFGNACWFAIVSLLPVNAAGVSTILVPLVAMLFGAWLHGEPLGPTQVGAMALSAAALALALLKPSGEVRSGG
ncbi:MAG: DMT family transporter [Burkholderiales bacterium]